MKIDDNLVDHPSHYISDAGIETIDVIEAFTSDLKGIEAVDTANILKYACRWKHKDGARDLKKLVWYAEHLIRHLEKEKENRSETELFATLAEAICRIAENKEG